jgi:DNA-binding response OmpR family regulator
MKARILVVDDEQPIRDLLRELLEGEGYDVVLAEDGQDGLKAFFASRPALVVLDILMPRMDGWKLLERIREVSDAPVIILSALDREQETVRGLRGGADDYVVKPMRRAEFLARVEAVLRKAHPGREAEEEYRDAAMHIDFPHHQVHLDGRRVELSPLEFRLLWALVRNANVVLSTDRLLDLCWGEGEGGPENVRVYIGYLRRRLGEDPRRPRLIETAREFGYRYRPPGS